MERFYWLADGRLAGCSRPGGRNGASLEADLMALRQEGIQSVLSLTESPLSDEMCARQNMVVLHLPIPDMHAPTSAELLQALYFIDSQHIEGRAVAVHCLMGQGRTGTVLAAYIIRDGASAEEAIARLRSICPGAIESPPQVRALHRFAGERAWIV
jgi:atypical dual specificity phosphatase